MRGTSFLEVLSVVVLVVQVVAPVVAAIVVAVSVALAPVVAAVVVALALVVAAVVVAAALAGAATPCLPRRLALRRRLRSHRFPAHRALHSLPLRPHFSHLHRERNLCRIWTWMGSKRLWI